MNVDNRITDDTNICLTTTSSSKIVERLHQQSKHNDEKVSCSSQEDECWDDAQALMQTDDKNDPLTDQKNDNFGSKDKSELSQANNHASIKNDVTNQPSAGKNDPSSSSAYSSIRSIAATTTTDSNNFSSLASQTRSSNLKDYETHLLNDLILHKAVFNDDVQTILSILANTELVKRNNLVDKRDKHGNTALHLACMLGRSKEIISAFLNCDPKWSIDAKNLNRWTPFHEACSYGNRDIIKLMTKQLSTEMDDAINNMKLSESLEKTKNYRLVLKWEFQSWVPLISRVLPSDTCVINKQGKFVRIDTRLLDFEGLFRKKGDSCLVYSNKKWIVMNNKTKKYDYFGNPNAIKDIDERVDEIMSTDIMDIEFKSSEMQLTRLTSGWFWKADKVASVGRYNAAMYDFTNVFLIMRKRREHLSEDDLKRNKSAYKTSVHIFEFGEKPSSRRGSNHRIKDLETSHDNEMGGTPPGSTAPLGDNDNEEEDRDEGEQDDEDEDETEQHRESLPPPPVRNITWQQYIDSEPPGCHPVLGREPKCKELKRAVKASVAMSDEFPITKQEFLEVLSIVPLKLFKKLKEFVELKLPDGFPVRLDLPIFPFLTARITFEDFSFHEGPIDESLFKIPTDYERDSNLLPSKLKGNSDDKNDTSTATNAESDDFTSDQAY